MRTQADRGGPTDRITTTTCDGLEPLPAATNSVDAVFAKMLLCMALSTAEIHSVLRPGGTLVRTVRHIGDGHCGTGTARGDDIDEHGGFAVHYLPRALVDELADGWHLREVQLSPRESCPAACDGSPRPFSPSRITGPHSGRQPVRAGRIRAVQRWVVKPWWRGALAL